MTLLFCLAADAVMLLHLAFVLFVVFGGLLVARRPRLAWLHLPAVAHGVLLGAEAVTLGIWTVIYL